MDIVKRPEYAKQSREVDRFIKTVQALGPDEGIREQFNDTDSLKRAMVKYYSRLKSRGFRGQFSIVERKEGSHFVLYIFKKL